MAFGKFTIHRTTKNRTLLLSILKSVKFNIQSPCAKKATFSGQSKMCVHYVTGPRGRWRPRPDRHLRIAGGQGPRHRVQLWGVDQVRVPPSRGEAAWIARLRDGVRPFLLAPRWNYNEVMGTTGANPTIVNRSQSYDRELQRNLQRHE
jgi:hypothetical protein